MNFLLTLAQKYPLINRILKLHYGLLPDPESDKDDIMGALSRFNWVKLREDGDWTGVFKELDMETQKKRFDTMGCVSFSLLNIVEMLAFQKWGETWNLSDRYLAKMSNTSRRGNNMRNVADTMRKLGAVNEDDWKWDAPFNWNEYYARIPAELTAKGQQWLKEYEFGYDAVWATASMMKEAIKYSPLWVGGYAWAKRGVLYYSYGKPNHAFVLTRYAPKIVGDSYDPFEKHLDENFKLYYIKRIYLAKKKQEFNKKEIMQFIKKGVRRLMRVEKHGEVWELSKDGIVYKSPDEYLKDNAVKDFKDGTMIPINEKDFYAKFLV